MNWNEPNHERRKRIMDKKNVLDLTRAKHAVIDAVYHLERIEGRTQAAERDTIIHFSGGLKEWLSSDNDETGFAPYVKRMIERRVA